ncbi:hypothetical protein ABT282_33600 [Streptomyces sp. NPDC000927]|uniref:DUF6928 family protein n=1 Tax=Streptomyces sp. NPDC000927 TaxID=3154371 RepID=UPI00331C1608
MGDNTALLFISDEHTLSPPRAAEAAVTCTGSAADPARAADLVAQWYPDERLEPIQGRPLGSVLCPRIGAVYAGRFDGIDIICDRQLTVARPSSLTGWVRSAAGDRRVVLHLMRSVVDQFAFAVWQGGELERSLSLSPNNGVVESTGDPMPFEAPYWRGSHPVTPDFDGAERYPLPFHPLSLGERALHALAGFIPVGRVDPGDIDAEDVPMRGFRRVLKET